MPLPHRKPPTQRKKVPQSPGKIARVRTGIMIRGKGFPKGGTEQIVSFFRPTTQKPATTGKAQKPLKRRSGI